MKWRKALNIIALMGGIGLLALFIYKVGPEKIWVYFQNVSYGFAWVLLVFLASTLLEVSSWRLIMRPEARTSFLNTFFASVAGSQLNVLFPGGQAGEVLKGNLLRGLVPTNQIVSSLVLYNFLYGVTRIPVLVIGPVWCLVSGDLRWEVSLGLLLGVGISAFTTFLVLLWLKRGMVTDVLKFLRKIPLVGGKIQDKIIEEGKKIDVEIRTFWKRRPRDFRKVCSLLFVARLIEIAEVWLIMFLLSASVSYGVAAAIRSAGTLVYFVVVLFPTRIGVIEGGSMLIFSWFGFTAELGLAMELVRRMRKIVFNIFGLSILLWLGICRRVGTSNDTGSGPGPGSAP